MDADSDIVLRATSCRLTAAFRLLRRIERRGKELHGYALGGIGLRGNELHRNGARPNYGHFAPKTIRSRERKFQV